ncbi:Mycobacterium rhizamassiliense ORFan [Mycobacterium rhizamassiliense]|uniref:Mycobacterium rhizamassiliense ORFan n=1 Tax=Mycobacterium rhizamassiliense TaxID=1841860 RepID=A0A2U3NVP9_9MYCO|nr:Mycobacterium rhizamassiliense ORFan [Mycobacterium rhizamassiliense]
MAHLTRIATDSLHYPGWGNGRRSRGPDSRKLRSSARV